MCFITYSFKCKEAKIAGKVLFVIARHLEVEILVFYF